MSESTGINLDNFISGDMSEDVFKSIIKEEIKEEYHPPDLVVTDGILDDSMFDDGIIPVDPEEMSEDLSDDGGDDDSLMEIETIDSGDDHIPISLDGLPEKTRKTYMVAYNKFLKWTEDNDIKTYTEESLIKYFDDLAERLKLSTYWPYLSMLRQVLSAKHKIDISKFLKLRKHVRKLSINYKPKKTKTLSFSEINKFLLEAPDDKYLHIKVALIFGITGGCHKSELCYLTNDDLVDTGSEVIIKIKKMDDEKSRIFSVVGRFYEIYKKYADSRPKNIEEKRFFLSYANGKCNYAVIGINKFGTMSKEIANFLNLPDANEYTGHCFRNSAITLASERQIKILNRYWQNPGSTSMVTAAEAQSAKVTTTVATATSTMTVTPIVSSSVSITTSNSVVPSSSAPTIILTSIASSITTPSTKIQLTPITQKRQLAVYPPSKKLALPVIKAVPQIRIENIMGGSKEILPNQQDKIISSQSNINFRVKMTDKVPINPLPVNPVIRTINPTNSINPINPLPQTPVKNTFTLTSNGSKIAFKPIPLQNANVNVITNNSNTPEVTIINTTTTNSVSESIPVTSGSSTKTSSKTPIYQTPSLHFHNCTNITINIIQKDEEDDQ